MHKDKGKPPFPPNVDNIGKKRFIVWGHFTVIERGKSQGQLVIIVAKPMLVILS